MLAKDYRASAWNKLSGKWGTMALCAFIYSVILGACSSFSAVDRVTTVAPVISMTFSLIGSVGSLLLGGPLTIGMCTLAINVSRGAEIKVEHLFNGFRNFARALALYVINSIFIALWSLLLIVPGIIKAISYSMSYYILTDNPNMDANEARKQSMAMMEGHKWSYFCLSLSFIGWALLCVLTLGILSFWISPYMRTAESEFYHSLLAERAQAAQQPAADGWTNATEYTQTQAPAAPVEEDSATNPPVEPAAQPATEQPVETYQPTDDTPAEPTDGNDDKQTE